MRTLVLREAARVVGIAVVIGGAIALGALLFGVTPTDWPTFVSVALLLAVVACAASDVPARRRCASIR